ncbi:TPA: hypothetical protein DDW69_02590 [candidate division CPR2 bacterium]|uniref:Double Cache domain-containing protein n=1 Tax=candidate division CPR2 bacterium GW2011_GWC1_41_48 TaxID=1618344 RepID=A0A0G0YH59_UNCC2|nr:MAG: hypothetical protein UT47_C0004G0017 [candidate division CPR2 bacterium GW2011_GWC2_39_35]KKR28901.1 MAG: hypothetical protein UT59_C0016G0005 [candidate division CPR2 bacterium GW2011_GWD1_39_7]KKS08891.1 MAG: hypothetical protein UU65_C0004G0102 [candidate division CPR2 bacterium GW2011_GWC1_41_48]OGB61728.1 MAG: hypothetical protein A2Y27_01290 [candidate division CPR2 bacterium GWD1_39_7]HBG81708.1 hypothetical protein [candidate division CPR2 bacterium]
MLNISKVIIRYPIESLLGLSLIPLLVISSDAATSNLLLIPAFFSVRLISVLYKNKSDIPPLISIVVLCALAYYFTLKLHWVWPISLMLFFGIFIYLKKKFSPILMKEKKALKIIYLSIISLTIFLPAVLQLYQKTNQTKEFNLLEKKLDEEMSTLQEKQKTSLNMVRQLSEDEYIKSNLNNKSAAELAAVLRSKMLASNLSYLVLTDHIGNVKIRAHKPGVAGDNIFESFPETKSVFEGRTYEGIEEGLESPLIIIAGAPIYNEDKINGAIFTGYLLNDDFARKESVALQESIAFYSNQKLYGYSSSNPGISSVFISSNIRGYLDTNSKDVIKKEAILENKNYLFAAKTIKNNRQITIGKVVIISENSETKIFAKDVSTFVGILVATIIIWFISKNKIILKRKSS